MRMRRSAEITRSLSFVIRQFDVIVHDVKKPVAWPSPRSLSFVDPDDGTYFLLEERRRRRRARVGCQGSKSFPLFSRLLTALLMYEYTRVRGDILKTKIRVKIMRLERTGDLHFLFLSLSPVSSLPDYLQGNVDIIRDVYQCGQQRTHRDRVR